MMSDEGGPRWGGTATTCDDGRAMTAKSGDTSAGGADGDCTKRDGGGSEMVIEVLLLRGSKINSCYHGSKIITTATERIVLLQEKRSDISNSTPQYCSYFQKIRDPSPERLHLDGASR
ncbi:hypothetical protein KSP40_PGU001782 [Platanthera guangdongensis]|uniref:Uncharacterized protein n=1 Tax=Platanthera guangdongensis TaxID=2320717 RepID=A0ABR2LJX4_9ASPA